MTALNQTPESPQDAARQSLAASPCSLFFGDCLEVMKGIESGSVDMVCADLPYGTTSCKWDCVIPLDALWTEYRRVCKPTAAIVLTATQPFTSQLVMSNSENYNCEWIWHKSKPSGVAFKTQPMRNHESVLVFGKIKTFNAIAEEREGFTAKSIARFASGKNLGTYRNHGNSTTGMGKTELKPIAKKRKPTTVKRFASIPNRLGTLHPSQKPVELIEYLMHTYSNEGETVLDNTMGSGTTGVAAMNTGRRFIGIEKDADFFRVASERIYSANAEVCRERSE